MAFDCLRQIKRFATPISYMGIDVNDLWSPIHMSIRDYCKKNDIRYQTHYYDVFDFFKDKNVPDPNIIVISYLISYLYNTDQITAINNLAEYLAQRAVKKKDMPLLLVINDVNSYKRGRNYFSYFVRLSKAVGRDRVIWRYDPIFFNADYTMEYHCKYFKKLAAMLSEYTEKCTVSFLDLYKNTTRNVQPLQIQVETHDQQLELLSIFSEIAHHYGIFIDTCAEAIELNGLQIPHACCIDKDRLERLGHCQLKVEKDKNQRPECGCVESIDIGAYNTCKNGCLYCYANYSGKTVQTNSEKHNPNSPLLFGEVVENDTVLERKVKSWKVSQVSLFDT